MKQEHRDQWEKTRSKGITSYIIKHGVLGYGIPMFILMTFVVSKPVEKYTASVIISNAFIWAFAGMIFGGITWRFTENRYEKSKSQEHTKLH